MAGAPPTYDEAATTKAPYPTEGAPYPPGPTHPPASTGAPYQAGPTYPPASTGAPVYPATNMAPPATGYGTNTTVVTPQPATANTVIVTQPTPVVLHRNPYGFIASNVMCPRCNQPTLTVLEYRTGGATWLACGITCLVGCWLGCCLIPFCIDALKDVVHKCGHCGQEIGYRKRLS